MDYLDLMLENKSYEDMVAEAEFRYELAREEEQLRYVEEKEKANGI